MKVFMQVYFILYVLSGGFRHIVFEAQFFNFLNNQDSSIWLTGAMFLLQILALAYVFWQRNEFLIVFYMLLFSTDLYVQNFIKFESSVILIHQLPLIAFLFLNEGKIRLSQDSLRYVLLLMIAVGFVSSGLSKLSSGWLNTYELNLKSHILTLQNRYAVPVILKADLLYLMPDWMWKLIDFLIVFFQLSFLSFFFSLRFLHLRFFALICFHWAISLSLGIHVFYSYLFIYILIFAPWDMKKTPLFLGWILKTVGIVFVLFFIVDSSDTDFVMKRMPLWFYMYYDLFLTFLFGIFLLIYMRLYHTKPIQNT